MFTFFSIKYINFLGGFIMLAKVMEVFTSNYKNEIEYRSFLLSSLFQFKLNNQSESVEKKIKRLSDKNFLSNFRIKLEERI